MTAISKIEHQKLKELLQKYEVAHSDNAFVREDCLHMEAIYTEYQEHLSALRYLITQYEVVQKRLRMAIKQEMRQQRKTILSEQ